MMQKQGFSASKQGPTGSKSLGKRPVSDPGTHAWKLVISTPTPQMDREWKTVCHRDQRVEEQIDDGASQTAFITQNSRGIKRIINVFLYFAMLILCMASLCAGYLGRIPSHPAFLYCRENHSRRLSRKNIKKNTASSTAL